MRSLKLVTVFAVLLVLVAPGQALEPTAQTPAASTPAGDVAKAKPAEVAKEEPETPPVVTHHEIRVGGKVLKYTATAGMLPIKDSEGKTEAHIFFVAYTLDNPASRRPLMFSFNGGPGSSSVWLHLGAVGPKRVKLRPNGEMPSPPFQLEDNQYTWLDQTDLVFIDPVGTGYSRPMTKELGKKFWGLKGDVESVGEFIRLYLTRYERWHSPLFLVGESYGTTRAAGLAGHLIRQGVALNGIVLVSAVLNFETLEFTRGNDLPYVLFLPSYTTTAWFHQKLPADLQQQDLPKLVAEVEQWATTEYAQALQKGDQLAPAERQAMIDRLARYSGLKQSYIDDANLRIPQPNFCKELMRDRKRTLGRLDSRFEGIDVSGISDSPEYDPSEAAIRPPFTATFNAYVRSELGYKTDLPYYILGSLGHPWEWGSAAEGFPNVTPALRDAMTQNRYMKIFVACGYYDLATPFAAAQYTLSHLELDSSLKDNITIGYYEAGHMMYVKNESLAKLKPDVAAFLQGALK